MWKDLIIGSKCDILIGKVSAEREANMKAAEKRKPVWGDALAALVILAAAGALLLALLPRSGGELTALVTVNGETVWTCPLEGLTEPVQYTVEGEYPLTLEISGHGVRVMESACPGEDCRHTGLISGAGQQIVCLPNRTVVTLNGDDPSFDAVVG